MEKLMENNTLKHLPASPASDTSIPSTQISKKFDDFWVYPMKFLWIQKVAVLAPFSNLVLQNFF